MIRAHRKKNRNILLLEVLIALSLVALCAVPLIYPHAVMLKSEREYTDEIDLSRISGEIRGEILEQMFKNEVPWEDIKEGIVKEISQGFIKHEVRLRKIIATMPYHGVYTISVIKDKIIHSDPAWRRYLIKISLSFKKKNEKKELKYDYIHFITKKTPTH